MSNDIKVLSVIICDDIRKEINNKELLVGVYSGSIYFPSFPCGMLSFCVRIEFYTTKDRIDDLTVEVRNPKGQPVWSITGGFALDRNLSDSASISFIDGGPIVFEQEGDYKVFFGPQKKLKPIYKFKVKKAPL